MDRAIAHRCDAFQIFAKNANQWRGRPLGSEEIGEFRAKVKASGLGPVVSHASYLINLATTNGPLRQQSLDEPRPGPDIFTAIVRIGTDGRVLQERLGR